MAIWARPALRASADERNRAPDVAQRPQCERETKHRRDAGVVPEPECQIVIAAGLEQGERVLYMLARFDVLSGEPMSDSSHAVGDTGLRRIGSRLNIAEERRRVLPHRRQFTVNVAADPQTEVSRQALMRGVVADCGLVGPGEGLRSFRRARPSRREERVAIGDVQLAPLLSSRRLGLDLVCLRQRFEQRLRLADLGHFGRRPETFERGRKNGVGIDGVADGLIEFGERQRRTEAEAARPLLTRDRDGSLQRPFRGEIGRAHV